MSHYGSAYALLHYKELNDYTYIKYTNENGQTVVELANAPAYFTMYDEATAAYKAN